jgi:hypothetical protein
LAAARAFALGTVSADFALGMHLLPLFGLARFVDPVEPFRYTFCRFKNDVVPKLGTAYDDQHTTARACSPWPSPPACTLTLPLPHGDVLFAHGCPWRLSIRIAGGKHE